MNTYTGPCTCGCGSTDGTCQRDLGPCDHPAHYYYRTIYGWGTACAECGEPW